jgi:hypothetical protein
VAEMPEKKVVDRTARCHCGLLRVIVTGEPKFVYICHCAACQRRTGAVVHTGCSYPKDRVRIEGTSKIFEREADSGRRTRFHFCGNCGSNVFFDGDRDPTSYGITVGSFADPDFPPPTFSVFEELMHPWLDVPSVADRFPQGLTRLPAAMTSAT